VAPRGKVRRDGAIGGEKALGVPGRLESLHLSFPLARGLVRVFRAVVEIAVLTMFYTRQKLTHRRLIAPQLVSHQHQRDAGQAPEEPPEELPCRSLVAPRLDQNFEGVTILIHCPPQVLTAPLDGQKHFVQVPLVPRPGRPATQCIGVRLPKLATPIAHRFICEDDAALGHQLFDVAIAQTKAELQPDRIADDLSREPMTLVGVGCRWWIHAASMPYQTGAGKQGRLI
jgi:hypothetical protein